MTYGERISLVIGIAIGLMFMLPPLILSMSDAKESAKAAKIATQATGRTPTTYLKFEPNETLCEQAGIQLIFRSGAEPGGESLYMKGDGGTLYLGVLLTDTFDVKITTQNCK